MWPFVELLLNQIPAMFSEASLPIEDFHSVGLGVRDQLALFLSDVTRT